MNHYQTMISPSKRASDLSLKMDSHKGRVSGISLIFVPQQEHDLPLIGVFKSTRLWVKCLNPLLRLHM